MTTTNIGTFRGLNPKHPNVYIRVMPLFYTNQW